MSDLTSERDDLRRQNEALRGNVAALGVELERYRTFFDNAPVGKCMTTPEGKLMRVNPAFGAMLGYSMHEMQSINFAAITHPDDVAESRECIRALLAAERDVWGMDKRYLAKDGRHVWTRVTTRLQRDDDGRPLHFLTHVQDISERKSAEQALLAERNSLELRVVERTAEIEKSRKLLDETARLARVGGWELDLKTKELVWSEVTRLIHEVGPDFQPSLEAGINFYAPEAIPVISKAVQGAIEAGEPFDVQLQLITAKDSRIWVRAVGRPQFENGTVTRIGGVFQDITELRGTREHLRDLVEQRTSELRLSQESLLEAQRVAQLGSWEWHAVNDAITGSEEFYRLFDVAPEGIARFSQFLDRLVPEDRERVQLAVDSTLRQHVVFDIDYRIRLGNGDWRDINAKGQVYVDEQGQSERMVGTCQDITNRKKVEAELRIKDQVFEDSIASQSVADTTGVITHVNPAFLRLWGYAANRDAVGKSVGSFFSNPLDAAAVQEALATHDAWQGEFLAQRTDRTTFISRGFATTMRDGRGELIGYQSANLDVTKERESELALALSTHELELRNRIAEVFLTTPGQEMYGRVLQILLDAFNSKFGLIGYIDEQGSLVVPSVSHPVGSRNLGHHKTLVVAKQQWGDGLWQTAIRSQRVLSSNDSSNLTLEGDNPVERCISAPIIHGATVVGLFLVANKDTDYDERDLALARTVANAIAPILEARLGYEREQLMRKRAEDKLQREALALTRSNQELEQFAYVASHDLQEPLRMVSSYTQLLGKRYADKLDQDAKDFIGFAVDGANRMQRLIQDLLAYSRITTRGQPPAPLDTHDALGEAVRNLQAAIQETGGLVTNGDLPCIVGDPTQIVQIFQNLVGNGLKFHKPGVPPLVHLSAERSTEQPDFWTFRVADNGIGIEPRHFSRLFVIFQRLHGKQDYPGTGIGLALCKRIVERHGGKVWLQSTPGEGTTILFTLPSTPSGQGA